MSKNRYDGCHPYLIQQVRYHARVLHQYVCLRHVPCQDLEQELMLFFLSRQHTYNPDKASWKTFVSRVLDCAHKRLMRQTYAQKRGWDVEHVLFDEDSDNPIGCDEFITAVIQPGSHRQCELHCELLKLLRTLPTDLATLLQQLHTMPLNDIAELTQTPYSKCHYQMRQLRAILKQRGIEITH